MDGTNLDIVSLVVVTALTEQAVGYDLVDIELVQDGISILSSIIESDENGDEADHLRTDFA